jgi:hypothetical protein
MDPLVAGHGLHSRAVLTGWIARRRNSVIIGTELLMSPEGGVAGVSSIISRCRTSFP